MHMEDTNLKLTAEKQSYVRIEKRSVNALYSSSYWDVNIQVEANLRKTSRY